jgi:hypothetical protein
MHSLAMQRRQWLKLGLASAAVLALAGGAAVLNQPGVDPTGRLTTSGRRVFGAAAGALLDGMLPATGPARVASTQQLLDRIDGLVVALPPHVQTELSQLLALLDTAPGRHLLAGLASDWPDSSVEDLQQALQGMRHSTMSLRQQAYHALHDITSAAYYADASTWQGIGYPGPLKI